ncbi:S-layer homology domain-containing protein [Paenibacillus tepidiphilus]|uniref:S-layer homology domain-containing protein n=1 Tax=Paenibacillus tepidiphilus TaxID=2608683 RepID=UPI0012387015|nr:S-layer homology domain-containing protein [Paenibacillus tepidiphilus]
MGVKSRASLTAILAASLLLGSMGTAGAQSAKDYEGHWAQQTIESWLSSGNLKGFADGSVKPNQRIRRSEFMALVNRAFGFTGTAGTDFADVDPNSWYAGEVAKAVAAGYMEGYNRLIRPNEAITRQEAAVVMGKLLHLDNGNVNELQIFSDTSQIAVWAKPSVAAAVKAGLLKGYPNGSFAPAQALTRAESLTVIGAAAALQDPGASAVPSATATPAPTASPSMAPSAVPVAGGGGGGGGGGAATAAPTATATPTAPATPTVTATPAPESPQTDIPLLKVKLTALPAASVTNAVYLEIDYSDVPEALVSTDGSSYVQLYVTTTPMTTRDFQWDLQTRRAIVTLPTYGTDRITELDLGLNELGGAGERYVTVLFTKQNEATGYYTEKVNLQPSRTQVSGVLPRLPDGAVTLEMDKQIIETSINGGTHYSDIIDVSNALGTVSGAVYYTISPKYVNDYSYDRQWSELLHSTLNLYTYPKVRSVDASSYPFHAVPDRMPLAVETAGNSINFNEQEYTILFYDRNFKALAYYAGKVHLKDELAVEIARNKIGALGSGAALAQEEAILTAQAAYNALADSLKAQFDDTLTAKLNASVAQLESEKYSGPLGNSLALVEARVEARYMVYNGSKILTYFEDRFHSLRKQITDMAIYVTKEPITASDLAEPSTTGKFAFSTLNYTYVEGLKGEYYATFVGYDSAGQPVRYATAKVNFDPLTPVWDGTAVRVTDGISLEREYRSGSRSDYAFYKDYLKAHPEVVYFTFGVKSEFAQDKAFTPEQVVQELTEVIPVSRSSSFWQLFFQPSNESLTGITEEYIIVFYDQNYKAIHYYMGSLSE